MSIGKFCGKIFGLVNPAYQCGWRVALPPPSFAFTQTAGDQGPMEVWCDVFVGSVNGCHGRQPLRLTQVFSAPWLDQLGRLT